MHTATLSTQLPERIPIPCTVYSADDKLHEEGRILSLSMRHCHIESPLEVFPGMTLALLAILPGTEQSILIHEAFVTWKRDSEFGVRLDAVWPDDRIPLETYISNIS